MCSAELNSEVSIMRETREIDKTGLTTNPQVGGVNPLRRVASLSVGY